MPVSVSADSPVCWWPYLMLITAGFSCSVEGDSLVVQPVDQVEASDRNFIALHHNALLAAAASLRSAAAGIAQHNRFVHEHQVKKSVRRRLTPKEALANPEDWVVK
jgi:hypothetical protein